MFRKTVFAIALLAILFTTLAPASAEAGAPPAPSFSGYIIALKPTNQIVIAHSTFNNKLVTILVDKTTTIRLGKTPLSLGDLKVGDFVEVTLRPDSASDTSGLWAAWIDVSRTTSLDRVRR